MGEEYIRFHRAYRLLSDRLAAAGYPVLRFDLFSCGDSSGEADEAGVSQWCTDIAAAVAEAKRRGHVKTICLVGLRLGGSLAVIVGAEKGDIDGMVLWDPIASGQDYLGELARSHQRMLQYAHVRPNRRWVKDKGLHAERLGFPLTASMCLDLEELNLLAIEQRPAGHILVVNSNERAFQGRLREHLEGTGASLTYQLFPDPRLWVWEEAVGRILVPNQILRFIASWISEVYA
jgi:pimeloyl-ACP methyl ester carboxylesterase